MKYSPSEMPDSTTKSEGVVNYGFQPELIQDTSGTNEKPQLTDVKEPTVEKSQEEKNKEKQEEAGVDDGIYCGVGACRPNFVQGCKTMACFSAVFSFTGLVTTALNAYITSQITTLERNFNFSSSVSGILLSCNDMGYLVTTLFMSYYTRRVHIPRAMALSTILYGVSGILCAVAFFATRVHLPSPPKENDDGDICSTPSSTIYLVVLYILLLSTLFCISFYYLPCSVSPSTIYPVLHLLLLFTLFCISFNYLHLFCTSFYYLPCSVSPSIYVFKKISFYNLPCSVSRSTIYTLLYLFLLSTLFCIYFYYLRCLKNYFSTIYFVVVYLLVLSILLCVISSTIYFVISVLHS